ncbi:MAG: type II toxin-antitoxin system Phd/YefM family antitoxin [Deltaproteobacteria bacterium]
MKTTTVGDVQKNFAKVLREIGAGEEILVLKRGKPVARIAALGPKRDIDWPNFYNEAIPLTAFHELEFKNALYLKQFRSEISEVQIQQVLSEFEDHQNREIYYRPPVDWANTMVRPQISLATIPKKQARDHWISCM